MTSTDEIATLVGKWASIDSTHSQEVIFEAIKADFMPWARLVQSYEKLLVFEIRPEAKTQVVLCGHTDTVLPPKEVPIKRENDLLRGAGVLDMKGGLAVLLKALILFESANPSRIGFKILINGDEEKGSPASTPLLQKWAKGAHFAFVFEPTLSDGTLVSARKASANYRVISRGKKAHTGREPEKGKNAIYPLAHFLTAVEDPSIHVGTIVGGVAANVVPDFASCELNIRSFDGLEGLEEKIKKSALKYGLELVMLSKKPAKSIDEKTEALFSLLQGCGQKLGMELSWQPTGGVCDGNTFAHLGIATIDTLGGTGDGMHTADEYVNLDSLLKKIELTASLFRALEQQ